MIICVGQAGIKLGQELLKFAEMEGKNCAYSSVHSWYNHQHGYYHVIYIDSDPETLIRVQNSKSKILPSNLIRGKRGVCANIWAAGFNEVELLEMAVEVIRSEAEKLSWLDTFMVIYSTSGGTGSGLGSALLQVLREQYPKMNVLSVTIGGFELDIPLQHFNTVFSIQYASEYADAVIYKSNQELLERACQQQDGSKFNGPVDFENFNKIYAQDIAGYFFPASYNLADTLPLEYGKYSGINQRMIDGNSVALNVCPFLRAKFANVYTTFVNENRNGQQSTEDCNWPVYCKLVKKVDSYVSRNGEFRRDCEGVRFKCIAAHSCLSGLYSQRSIERKMIDPEICTSKKYIELQENLRAALNVNQLEFKIDLPFSPALSCFGRKQCLSVCFNSTSSATKIRRTLDRAREIFDAGAYRHIYFKHGLEEQDFDAAFNCLENIISEYKSFN